MPKILNYLVPGAVLLGGLWMGATSSYGTPAYTSKENKACVYCHVTAASKELNEAGKYYKDHDHSLKGYQPAKK